MALIIIIIIIITIMPPTVISCILAHLPPIMQTYWYMLYILASINIH